MKLPHAARSIACALLGLVNLRPLLAFGQGTSITTITLSLLHILMGKRDRHRPRGHDRL